MAGFDEKKFHKKQNITIIMCIVLVVIGIISIVTGAVLPSVSEENDSYADGYNSSESDANDYGYIYSGDYVFYHDRNYGYTLEQYNGSETSLTLPDAINGSPYSIGDAFYECGWLESIVIPDGVTSIGDYAFYSCTLLESVTIGSGVTYIGEGAFCECCSLELIDIGSGVMQIGCWAFYDTAYYNEESNWVDNVLYIGNYLIEADTSISGEYSIKNDTTVVADCAFEDCVSLESIIIPDNVQSIGFRALAWCTSLENITIGSGVTKISCDAFYDTAYYNDTNNWGNGVLYIDNCLIAADASVTGEYSIKDGTTVIADYAFYYCDSLTGITIPDSVKSIGRYAFEGCTALESITIGSSVTSIGSNAFYGCWSLESVTFENTSGWYVTLIELDSDGIYISADDLTYTDVAATYLRSYYNYYYWYRSE